MTSSEIQYDVDLDDVLDWYDRLSNATDTIHDSLKLRDILYLYFLYRDMFSTTSGPIEEDMVMLLDTGRIAIDSEGIQRTMYLYDHQNVDPYILMIEGTIKQIDIPDESHLQTSYLSKLPQLHTITVYPTEALRRSSADDIDWDDYTAEVPNDLENMSIRIAKSTR